MINNRRNMINNNNNNKLGQLSRIIAGIPGSLPMRAVNFAQLGRTIYQSLTGNRRVNKRNPKFQIEVNKAVGGNKSVSNTGKIIEQTVNFYSSIVVGNNQYYFNVANQPVRALNIQQLLNNDDEFLTLRKKALEYKIKSISVSFNYCYIAQQGFKVPKIVLTPETDTVLQVEDPLKNRNTMTWDMTIQGTKNFNFYLNKRNTEESNLEWQNSAAQWSAIAILHLSEVSSVEMESNINLGDVKISVQVLYKPVDTQVVPNKNRISKYQMEEYVRTKIKEERKEKEQNDKIQKNIK
jgi:hypothetical protein